MLARPWSATATVAVTLTLAGCGASARPPASPAAPVRLGVTPSPAVGAPSVAPNASDATASARPAALDADEAEDGAEQGLEDDLDVERPSEGAVVPPHPLAGLSDADLERKLVSDPASLGSMSIGKTNAGLLFNAVQMTPGDAWTVVVPSEAWGTEETIHYLETAIHAVSAEFPDTPKLAIGDISVRNGGHLNPHLSHQAGRDVDISYFYRDGVHWYERATAENLDVARTWAFVRALVTRTDVELLLIDHSLQVLLRAEAERIGEDDGWLDSLFHGTGRLPPLIRHWPGHATHMHIRFYNPIAEETGRRLYPALVRHHLIHVAPAYAVHVARKGETLAQIARRYHSTVRSIRRANGLRSTLIQAKKSYRIPQPGHAPPSIGSGPIAIPPRRLPPARPANTGPSASAPSSDRARSVHARPSRT